MENLELTNIHFLTSAGAALIIFLLALYILKKNPYSAVNKFFGAYALVVVLWAFSSAMDAAVLNPEIGLLWDKIGNIGLVLLGPFFFLFILAFVKKYNWLNNFFIYIFLIGISLFIYCWLYFLDPPPIESLYRTSWGWESDRPWSLMSQLLMFWVASVMMAGLAFCWQFYKKTKDTLEKKQAGLILIAGAVPLLLGLLSQGIFPQIDISEWILRTSKILFSLSSLVLVVPLAYAALKYRLFTGLTPATTADAIIDTMKDVLIVANSRIQIELVNPFALKLLSRKRDELIGKPLGYIFSAKEWDRVNQEIISKIQKGEDVVNIEANLLSKDRELIPISISGGSLTGEKGNLIGIVIVAKDIRETRRLIEKLEEKSLELAEKIKDLEVAGGIAEKTRLATLNILEDVEEARAALQERVEELEKFNRLAVGRELKMIELKEEIKRLKTLADKKNHGKL